VGQLAIRVNAITADVLLARMMCGPSMQRMAPVTTLAVPVSPGSWRQII